MSDRIAEIVILGEDQLHLNLVRRYLETAGYSGRHIRELPISAGLGSGEQRVRTEYAVQVQAIRNARTRRRACLVVITDADMREVADVKRTLDDMLVSGDGRRQPGEPIVLLVPKRAVETWILHLNGQEVDEATDHSSYDPERAEVRKAATRLRELSRQTGELASNLLPSLRAAVPELRRIESEQSRIA